MKAKPLCPMCDKRKFPLSSRGWCDQCEQEFAEWKARQPEHCDADCPTPISCRIANKCQRAEQRRLAESDIATDPDLQHTHSAADIE